MSGAKEILIGLTMFSLIIVISGSFLTELFSNSGQTFDDEKFQQLDVFNKTFAEINLMKDRIKGAETNPLGTVSVIATGAWITVKNLFGVIPFVEEVGTVITQEFGISENIYYAAIAILTLLVVFVILNYVTGR